MLDRWQRFACFKTIDMLLDQTSARWTIILPAGAFTRYLRILSKNFGVGLSAFLRVADAASSCDPEVFSSKRAAYYVRLFVSVNTFFRSLLPSLRVGVHRGEDRVAARERILKTSENSSSVFVDLFHQRVIRACCPSTSAAARALRVLPQAC